jgi:hypothetical protein
MSIKLHGAVRHHILEDSIFHGHHCENLKTNAIIKKFTDMKPAEMHNLTAVISIHGFYEYPFHLPILPIDKF